MNNETVHVERIKAIFQPTENGVFGIVESLFTFAVYHQPLKLDWLDNRCLMRWPENESIESIELSIPQSVFRAILARIATLCRTSSTNPLSPYGGECELKLEENTNTTYHIIFNNVPDEQSLEVTCR